MHWTVITNPATGIAPIARALQMAATTGALLDLVCLIAPPPQGDDGAAARTARDWLEATAATLCPGRQRPVLHVVSGSADTVLAGSGAELLITGTALARDHIEARLPLLCVATETLPGQLPDPYRAIVIGVDFAADTQALIDRAVQTAPGAAVHLVHSYVVPFGTPPMAVSEGLAYGQMLELNAEIDRFRDRQQAGTASATGPVAAHVRAGEVAEVLAAVVAEIGADLLVLGRHWRTGLAEMIFGQDEMLLLDHPPCDVLLVPAARTGPRQ